MNKSPLALPFLFLAVLAHAAEPVENDRFEKEVVVNGLRDPMQFEVLRDGRILIAERDGAVKMAKPDTRQVVTLGTIPVIVVKEVGLLGFAADRDFLRTGWIYLSFCPAAKTDVMRVSRFTVVGDALDLASESKVLEYPIDAKEAIHMGGGMAMDARGNLYLGTGDNSPPIPELPVDQRPGFETHDSFRSAGNSNDLRGKILRVHPKPTGGYDIPESNLFPNRKDGRPEIFCMGCRNPFRLAVDDGTGWLYWGDVGPNIAPDLGIGLDGYDEINQTRKAGNYGWPMFNGPNEAFRNFDFTTRKAGELFDARKPVNASKNNTGLKELPPPQPALLWYPSGLSKEFPEFGTGGRSGMPGPVYRHDAKAGPLRLPDSYDGVLFVFEWMRNWIKAVRLDDRGRVAKIEAFLPNMLFRKPMEMKVGPDGTMYVLEFGDKWRDNRDSQITRIVYRRGNRPPVAIATADPVAGKQPLKVRLSGGRSFDKDKDHLTYEWRHSHSSPPLSKGGLGGSKPMLEGSLPEAAGKPSTPPTPPLKGGEKNETPTLKGGEKNQNEGAKSNSVFATGPEATVMFDQPGTYPVELKVIDSHGASSTTRVEVRVGNAPPVVALRGALPGSFFDWNQRLDFHASVRDEEDGGTADGRIPSESVRVQAQYLTRHRPEGDDTALEPGLALMRRGTCFSCHLAQSASEGPPYAEVSRKYQGDALARDRLAKKVLTGGGGVWGPKPMPPHPQHTIDEARLMVDWVMSLAASGASTTVTGTDVVLKTPKPVPRVAEGGVFVLTASYTDRGVAGAPPLTGESVVVLHARRKRPVAFDHRRGVELMDVLGAGTVGRFSAGDWIAFDGVNLAGIDRVTCRVSTSDTTDAALEVRADAPDGPILARCPVPRGKAGRFAEITAPIRDPGGRHSLFVVCRVEGPPAGYAVSLDWIEFLDSPEVAKARREDQARLARRPLAKPAPALKARTFVKEWTADDLHPLLAQLDRSRSFERGKELFASASCASCHKMGKDGAAVGPDLTDVYRRLTEKEDPGRALVRELVTPSKVIDPKYRAVRIDTASGQTVTGLIVKQDERELWVVTNPLAPAEVTKVPAADVEKKTDLATSLMPEGLLNTLGPDEIMDLLAYLKAGGDAKHGVYRK